MAVNVLIENCARSRSRCDISLRELDDVGAKLQRRSWRVAGLFLSSGREKGYK